QKWWGWLKRPTWDWICPWTYEARHFKNASGRRYATYLRAQPPAMLRLRNVSKCPKRYGLSPKLAAPTIWRLQFHATVLFAAMAIFQDIAGVWNVNASCWNERQQR